MTDSAESRTYATEDIERFVTALAAVATPVSPLGASERELYDRLATIRVVAEDLLKQITSDDLPGTGVNWVQYYTGTLERMGADSAQHYSEGQ
ncbi:hypothetical protein AB0F17_59435 [Nonomuraea sp. NPDC026600]|uniref:hypothetical protein n=1 Tax=Nonomuraea sp. NPDC026600 TaxID=3155363 RepID=UPI00340D0D57